MEMERPKLEYIRCDELMNMQLPPAKYTVEEILPTGLTVFAGAPKVGKSLFVLKLCLSVAKGENFWCYPTRKGTVLYMALEDSMVRLQSRLFSLADDGTSNLCIATRAPRLDEGLLDALKQFLLEHRDTRLIVIDTFMLVRAPAKSSGQTMYERDYVEMHQFQQFALDNDISVVLVHHGKKAEESDPFKQASGSMGMTAAADGYLLLKRLDRAKQEGTLYVSGRDGGTRDVQIKMTDDALWELAEEVEYEADSWNPYIRAVVLYLTSQTNIAKLSVGTGKQRKECNTLRIQATELCDGINAYLQLTGEEMLKPNMVKKKLIQYHTQLEELGFRFESERTGNSRTLIFYLLLDRAKVLRFADGKLPAEVPLLVQQVNAPRRDSMTADSLDITDIGKEVHVPGTVNS